VDVGETKELAGAGAKVGRKGQGGGTVPKWHKRQRPLSITGGVLAHYLPFLSTII